MSTPLVILASNSPRRKMLLQLIDIDFDVLPSQIDEDFSISLSPEKFVCHYAKLKADDIAKDHQDRLVIGADTVVVHNNQILGKPKNLRDSKAMLQQLSGGTHRVITGVTIDWRKHNFHDVFFETTEVTFNSLTDVVIDYYIDNYNPSDKAGSYGIQDWFASQVTKVNGCFYNVMGFPLSRFYRHYQQCLEKVKY